MTPASDMTALITGAAMIGYATACILLPISAMVASHYAQRCFQELRKLNAHYDRAMRARDERAKRRAQP
jgi:hypothetical protein